jgi:hypothetical protein
MPASAITAVKHSRNAHKSTFPMLPTLSTNARAAPFCFFMQSLLPPGAAAINEKTVPRRGQFII